MIRSTLQLGDPRLRTPCTAPQIGAAVRMVYLHVDRPWVLDGTHHTLRADGELGELLQHEIDHLNGILAVDRMTDALTLCMRSEFELRYRDESPYHQ